MKNGVMRMKKILVIGAGFLQDFVIRRSKELGYYTIAIDGNPEAIGLTHADKSAVVDIVNQEDCYEFAKKEKIDGVLTAATDYGVLSTSYIAERLGLPGLKYEVAQRIKNKYEVRKRLIAADADDTREAYEVGNDTNLNGIEIHQYPVIVKPCDGSGSRAIRRVDVVDELRSACEDAIKSSRVHKALIETFIAGREYGAESIVINGDIHVLGVMKKWMTKPPYYAELGHQIPSELAQELEFKVHRSVIKAIKALEINHGAVNMDLIIGASGEVHIVDIGARMGGNMIGPCIIPIGTGINYLDNLIRTAAGDKPDWEKKEPRKICTRLLAFKGGIVYRLPDFNKLEKEYGVTIYHHMKQGDKVNEYHTNLDGCGYIIADDAYTADIVLEEIAQCIK